MISSHRRTASSWIGFVAIVGAIGSIGLAEPENTLCPIGKEPIDPKTPTIVYRGHEIGFCCPGCDKEFLAWTEKEKDAFVATVAQARTQPDNVLCPVTREKINPAIEVLEVDGLRIGFADAGARREFRLWDGETRDAFLARLKAGAEWGDPFTLAECPVSGDQFDAEVDPVIVFHQGRQVRLCCAGCIEKFEADPAKYLRAADDAMIKSQLPFYPLDVCLVAGERLGADAVNHVYRNRLVRLCCEGCIKEFEANAPELLAKLDRATMEAQRETYPLESCVVVPKDRLGDHKEAYDVVIANRLVRLCCSGCEGSLLRNPAKYLATLEKARERARSGR